MTFVDWVIVAVMVLAAVGGVSQGFFRSVFSLGGLFFGLLLAAWNYPRAAAILLPLVRVEPVADAIGFLAIALIVMVLAGIAGTIIAKTVHHMGLGCLDRLAGGAFGLLQGALLVMLCILVAVAFFPGARWLTEAKLPKAFFGACNVTAHISPDELAERVKEGLRMLKKESPSWLHTGDGGI